jgi:myo-inositol-1(or 4)-monophosphatase
VESILDAAIAGAEAGGSILRERIGRPGAVRTKSSSFDLVTEADLASGLAVVRTIAEHVEGARFVIEEPEVYALAGVSAGDLGDDEVWVVDPLDGTTSYVHGYPCYSVSVALLRGGEPAVGAVHNASARETSWAAVGGGAWCDGVRLVCSDAVDFGSSLMITGFPYDRTTTLDRQLSVFTSLIRNVHDIRRDGSAAIDCCHVAAGKADAFWEFGLMPWDTAAGVVILREAGASITDLHGEAWSVGTRDICAANPALHASLLDTIRTILDGG